MLRRKGTPVDIYVDKSTLFFFNQNTFIGVEFSNFIIFDKKYILKFYGKVKIIKALAGFDFMTQIYSNSLRYADK